MTNIELENEEKVGPYGERIFDNPLALLSLKLKHKVLEKEDVAFIFDVSVKTISRMMADDSLPFHYVGNKPRFYLDEVITAFRNDSLNFERRNSHDKKNNQYRWNGAVPGQSNGSGPKTLQEVRDAAGRGRMD